jgi:hypothetical protein
MAMVPKYTSRASVPGSTGQQQVSLSLASSPLSGVGEGLTKVAGQLEAAASRIQAREDIISSAVANDEFEQETLKDYNATIGAGNVLDPKLNTIGNFNAGVEQRIMQTVNNFGGSANAKAQLEASLRGRAGQYANQMIRYQNTEQRKYITETAQNEMAPIISAITKDPSALRGSVEQIEAIVSKYAPALDPASQRSLRDAALSGAMEQSITGLLNRGAWKEANSMLMDNPILMRYLDPSKKDQFNRQIANFAQVENKSRAEMAGRIATLDMLEAAGYPVDPKRAANFIADATVAPDATLGEKITATGKSLVETGMMTQDEFNKLPINIKASFGGVKLPERPPVDYNKDFLPGGKLSPKGVFGRIKPYMEASTEIQRQSSMLENLYAQYKTNPLAGLGILQGYLKMIDDGAVVRDSDIRLAESASSAATRFQTAINSLTKGEAVSESLVEQAILAARAFTSGANEVSKTTVDGYLEDTGYSMMQMGYPQATYDLLFSKTRTVPLKKEQVDEVGGTGTAAAAAAKKADPGVVVITRNPDGTLDMGN